MKTNDTRLVAKKKRKYEMKVFFCFKTKITKFELLQLKQKIKKIFVKVSSVVEI